jgi:uncharacterized lipoprotein
VRALVAGVAAALLLPGCTLFHHRRGPGACREPQFNGSALTLPPLKAPPGLNAPNTSAGVKIPALNATDTPRPRNAPCLDVPPKYVPETPTPPVRRPAQPSP